ncbi:MAG: zinc ribbon domain-containing protein [Oscillospiraceae bacterium]|nr:zinc ribbon domain-containing protein [Oscillospiraceae bacterium]
MERTCSFCGLNIPDGAEVCPNCGAPVAESEAGLPRREGPRSLDELKEYCREHRLSPEKILFSIGEDSDEPRVNGIFREPGGDYVVFRNKSDGTRLERYRGPDEEEAVQVLYPRLRDELARRRSADYAASRSAGPVRRRAGCLSRSMLIVIILIIILSLVFTFLDKRPSKGYYRFNEVYYYYESGEWYYYSASMLDWLPAGSLDPELKDDFRDFFQSSVYLDSFPVPDYNDQSRGALGDPEGTAEPNQDQGGSYSG